MSPTQDDDVPAITPAAEQSVVSQLYVYVTVRPMLPDDLPVSVSFGPEARTKMGMATCADQRQNRHALPLFAWTPL